MTRTECSSCGQAFRVSPTTVEQSWVCPACSRKTASGTTTSSAVEEMRRLYGLAHHRIDRGTREECDDFGRQMVFWAKSGKHFAPNALAAILEEYRALYRARFSRDGKPKSTWYAEVRGGRVAIEEPEWYRARAERRDSLGRTENERRVERAKNGIEAAKKRNLEARDRAYEAACENRYWAKRS